MYVFRRIGSMVVVVWLAATLAFFALRLLPGDAIVSQLAQVGVPEEIIEEYRVIEGLTDPAGVQYTRFLVGLLRGDLGNSLLSREPVTEMIARNIVPTVTLAVPALILASVFGIVLGVAGALRWGIPTHMARILTNIALSVPLYWTGTLAIYVFTVQLGLLPSAGAGRLSQLILPVGVLGFHTAGAIARVTQANVRTVLDAEFVQVARAKGLRERRVLFRHVLRVGLLPIAQVIALQAGFLLSGTVITEMLFVRPGIGKLLYDSTLKQDYPVVQGVVIFSAVVYVVLNTLADALYPLLDPRVVE